jgi:hypothetical protein
MVSFCFTLPSFILNIGGHIYALLILLFLFLINTDGDASRGIVHMAGYPTISNVPRSPASLGPSAPLGQPGS